jgi:type I restriction enzyme, S subunit
MKNSGIPWIGEIPKHWGIVALGYVCNLTSGGTTDRNRPEYWNGNIPWVKTGEINYNQINQTEEYITELGLNNSSTKLASAGTLLMAMYGQGVTRGRVAILGIEASFNQACLAIAPQ